MRKEFTRRGARRGRGALSALLVGALIAGLGALGVPAAVAAPPVTFALSTVDLATGAPVTHVESGKDFTYVASVGCPDPNGCGPASLSLTFPSPVEFVADAFNPPTGARVESVEPGADDSTVVTLRWDALDGTAVAFLPARIAAMVPAHLDGSQLTATGMLTAGAPGDETVSEGAVTVTLNAYEHPGIEQEAQAWSASTITEGSTGATAEVTSTVRGTAAANAPSTLVFRVPGGQALPGSTLAAAQAFDLTGLRIDRNPSGAEVVFTLADGGTSSATIAAGALEIAVPADAVGYELRVLGLPGLENPSAAERTVVVTADARLRATDRDGNRIVLDGTNSRQVRITADVSNEVARPTPGTDPAVSKATRADIRVDAVLPTISHDLTWLTDSGESTSVYGSGEASTVTLRASNSGIPGLRDLTLTMPHLNSRYFDYQELSAPPRLRLPAGATGATIQYLYGNAQTPGAVQQVTPGAAGAWVNAPGPEAGAPVPDEDSPALGQVSGIVVVFTAADGSVIAGECAVSEDCAGGVELRGTLRTALRSTGAEIIPPATGSGETTVGAIAQVVAKAATGATLTQTTAQATLRLVKPQITVKLGKRFGREDGSDQTVYPLTGIAHAGDHYDPEKDPQDFADHPLRFVASTVAKEGASEGTGARELRISDPQQAPKLNTLKNSPFNTIRVTALSADPAVCTTGSDADERPVPSTTEQWVWVVDRADEPQTITKVPFEASIDPALIVGIEILIAPRDAEFFPTDVRCASAPGSTVKFRDTQMVGGAKVSPETIGAPETPGLLSVGNVARVGTGPNGDTADGADSLFLVDLLRAAMYKHYTSGAARSGIAGQEPRTSFVLSGVPAASDSVRSVLTDRGGAHESLDVFELTGVRGARVGPDQKLLVRFVDGAGAPIGPEGVVEASTELKLENGSTRQLTDEEIADSQSTGYLDFQRIEREIDWDRDWTDGEMTRVGGVEISVVRADGTEALQRFGAFSAVLDMKLRTNFLNDPGTRVTGSNAGTKYRNVASIVSVNLAGDRSDVLTSSVPFGVFEASELFIDTAVTWRGLNQAGTPADGYLVAQYQTPSRITLDAQNRTALGAEGVDAWKQWEQPGTIGVGLAKLGTGIGGAAPSPAPGLDECVAERDRNPFAINDFAGIHGMTWPIENAAQTKPGEDPPRIAARITYTFASGADEVVEAPVDADIADLNPSTARWGDVVGVSVEWAENGKFVGVHRKSGGTAGRVSFDLTLRDALRTGFNYQYVAGVPQCLSGATPSNEVPIDGALQLEGQTVDQMAQAAPVVSGSFDGMVGRMATADELGANPDWRFAEIMVDVEKSSVEVGVAAPAGAIYRDIAQSPTPLKRWTVSITNTGNLDVSALRLATDSALLGGQWPDGDPADFAPVRGSMFDAFDATGASLRLPSGATGAEVWVRSEDGSWGQATVTAQNRIELPTSGAGPREWGEVTGFRVQFTGDDGQRKRIIRGAQGSLLIDSVLRTHLRSDPSELAPATDLPQAAQRWESSLTAAGVSFIGGFDAPRSQVHDANGAATILPGAPAPRVKKYTSYDADRNTGTTATNANPGSWVNFTVVLENRSTATSNLSGISAVDTLPAELAYNAVNDGARWSALVYRLGEQPVDATSELQFALDTSGATQVMRWTAPADWELRPGERIVIRVPLQLGDGVEAGSTARNTARIVGSGIPGATPVSICADEASTAGDCSAEAYATTLRNDSVRAESYIDATAGGWDTIDRMGCDASSISDWSDGTWVRNPCIAKTTVGSTLTYRLKLINSGNMDLSELRFVDKLPAADDRGAVLDSARGSAWNAGYIPGSARLLTGTEAEALGARGDGSLNGGGFRFTADAASAGDADNAPCRLVRDAYSGADTLDCAHPGVQWSASDSASTRAFGGDIAFAADKLRGGDFVIVEFQARAPEERPAESSGTPLMGWNSVATTARPTPVSYWLPASESPRSGARWEDTAMTLSLSLAEGPATDWHFTAREYAATVSCSVPGRDPATPLVREVTFPGIASVPGTIPVTVEDLPVGGICSVSDVRYDPVPATAAGQYGSAAASPAPTGFAYAAEPADGIELALEPAGNVLAITNSFTEATVELGVDVTGSAASYLPADARFDVALSCSFGGETRDLGSFALAPGERQLVGGLPVGANCTATETEHRGAATVTATVDGAPAEVSAARSVELATIEAGAHTAYFLNEFAAGGALTILKTVDAPDASTAIGDVGFGISCTLGGHEIALGEQASLGFSFAPGQREASGSLTGLPAGAECTVTEHEAGGANIAAPDRTVTVLPDAEVIVEMRNTFSPAALELEKRVTGAGAGESRVPGAFDLRASCTRELTIAGETRTVTDHDALARVVPGEPTSIANLPEGSRCAVTEPDTAGAERTTVELATAGLTDEDPADDAVLVALRGPDAAGAAQATAVRVTNEYAKTGGLTTTGASGGLLGGAAVLLLLGTALLLVRRRRQTRA